MHARWASLCALVCALPALADPPAYLVKDIDTTPVGNFSLSRIRDAGGGAAYFSAQRLENGAELWKSDGTAAGTFMVADLIVGSSSPTPYQNVGGAFLFAAAANGVGRELWKTDGSAAGTSLVKDILPGEASSSPTADFAVVNGVLYFGANDGTHGFELWRSDGSSAGTTLVADINPGGANGSPQQLRSVNGTLYFTANDGTHGAELWKSDGTQAGTVPVYELPGSLNVLQLVDVGGTLFFTVSGAQQLWKSDGTNAGTAVVRVFGSHVELLVNANGTLFFRASDVANFDELWKSDGTAAGTVMVYEVLPGAQDDFAIWELVAAGNRAFFTTASLSWPNFDPRLWTSDGTAAGTVELLSLGVSPDAEAPDFHTFGSVGSTLYFAGSQASDYNVELWKSDGSVAGTVRVADLLPGPAGSFPEELTNVNGELWFEATGPQGTQLWKSDGTPSGTSPITSLAGTESSIVNNVAALDDLLLFTLGYTDVEPWRSDGTAAGTAVLKDIQVGPESSFPGPFVRSNGRLFFGADDGVRGRELWKTDGTSAGTVLVKDIWPGVFTSSPSLLAAIGGVVYFGADDGLLGKELWRSDGTNAGTSRVKDLAPGSASSNPGGTNGGAANVNGTLFFTTTNPAPGGLWKSDGSEAGTVQIASFAPTSLTNVDGTLFFTMTMVATGNELWKSDGTPAGTVLVADIWPGTNSSSPARLTSWNGTLFFTANDGIHGTELWRSDGTAAGTVLARDVVPGPTSQTLNFRDRVVAADALYFIASDGVSGFELWKSNGTGAGTTMVKDVFPGPANGALLTPPVAVGSIVVFSGVDPVFGNEVWASDGTAENTHVVADISPGFGGTTPLDFFRAGSRVFFEAITDATGRELFAIPTAVFGDSDGDGLEDTVETTLGTNPFDADTDDDGLRDGDEVNTHGTNPLVADTDGDGASDGNEILAGTDPLDPQSVPPAVPLVGPLALGVLVSLLLASTAVVTRRPR